MPIDRMRYRVMYGPLDSMVPVATFAYSMDARKYIRDAWLSANESCSAWNADIVESIVIPAIMRLGIDTAAQADSPTIGNAWRITSMRVHGSSADAHEAILERAADIGCESVVTGWHSVDGSAMPSARGYLPTHEGSARAYVDIVAQPHAAQRLNRFDAYHIAESWFDAAGDPMPAPAQASA